MLLLQASAFDCWLIRYPAGFELPVHTDPLTGAVHWRLNILLRGEDNFHGDHAWKIGPLTCFQSSKPHGVLRTSRPRLILSIGWKRSVTA